MPLTITPANVGIGALATITRPVVVGEAVTQGQVGYSAATGKRLRADANLSQATAEADSIFLTAGAGDNSIAIVALRGPVIIGATLVVGATYFLSSETGQIERESELSAGDWVTPLGVAISTTVLDFDPRPSRVQVPA